VGQTIVVVFGAHPCANATSSPIDTILVALILPTVTATPTGWTDTRSPCMRSTRSEPTKPGSSASVLKDLTGHGYTDTDGDLYLTKPTTDSKLWRYTALPYHQLRQLITHGPASNTVMLLEELSPPVNRQARTMLTSS
jgi:hypothetical protein